MVKWNGCCVLCDKEVFEIETRYVEAFVGPGSVFLGRPKDIGKPLTVARRLTFRLSDNTDADITFCEDCATGAADRLPEIWGRCLGAFRFENEHRVEFGFDNSPERIETANELIEYLSMVTITSLAGSELWQ